MPDVQTFAPGSPVWFDVSSTDLEGSKAFYTRLFGWEAQATPPEGGGYTMFTLGGKYVAAAGPTQGPEQPPHWMVYFGTEDADASARKVEEGGGKVVAPPFDVLQAGRMAVFQDPTGAFFSVWQPGQHRGVQVVGEPSSYAWTELNTRGMDRAKPFYQRVFGWGERTTPMGEGQPPYTEWLLGDHSIGGGMDIGQRPDIPKEVPPHWMNYFAVADVDATVEKASRLGAKALVPGMDFPGGRFAILQDPQGAAFGVLKMGG
jgi:predicted enzyme related to lactoylglutathione lyase